ncbi:prolyl oligopeptidase family serine peptidase [Gramella sp. AN32]|uniref:Prolyl oligopeptidase family serine peptidase n=1 Tax=Christiangramia antarctica TaxID=2058158 RepID=A0ABW5X0R3_9FLAO|nr:prolyl oligopeptidase family serine peptidase [Gramella sp. AN32]
MRNWINLKKNYTLILGLLLFYIPSMVSGQRLSEQEILDSFSHKETVVYKTIDDVELNMTIFYPDSVKIQDKNSWMMHVHGGGWSGGHKYNVLKKSFLGTLRSLVDNGVVGVTIEYRLARENTTAYDAVVDAKDAARFLLKNADQFKLDKKRYGVWGGSAGGHLSLLTALGKNADFKGDLELADFEPDFKCIVSYFPFTSCLNPELRPGSIFEDEKLFERLLGAPLEEKPELAKLLSPTEYLDTNSPPILLLHGDKDTILPIINSTYMVEVAKEKNSNVELLTIKNAGHSFNGNNISPSIKELNDYAFRFMRTHLK